MKFSEILRGIYSINVLQEDVFEIARSEILEECHSMKNHWDWQRRIIQFITDNQVDVLPVGNVRDIKGFEIKDAVTFMNTFYSTGNCALIIQTSLPIDDIKNLVLPIVEEYINFSDPEYIIPTKLTGNCSDAINDELVRTVFLDNSTGLTLMEFFFQRAYERLDLEKKITRMLFEIISKIRIRDYINNSNNHDGFQDNFVSDKHISEHYYYTVFTLQFLQPIKNASDFAEEAVLFLKQYEISEAELLHAKQILTDFMNETNLTTHDDIFENLSANFFYEEPIHITVQHYDQIKSIMDRIKLADVKTYKCWALTGPCKIVISS